MTIHGYVAVPAAMQRLHAEDGEQPFRRAGRFFVLRADDLRQAAVIVAATAWHLAMRDELVPRKPLETSEN